MHYLRRQVSLRTYTSSIKKRYLKNVLKVLGQLRRLRL
nr:MAG TPA: hypothetical protein [Caudoviricetes sp.]